MSNVHIAVHTSSGEAFKKQWPMAKHVGNDGRTFSIYALPRRVYEKQYLKRDDKVGEITGKITGVPSTNYVKLTGSIEGQQLRLFIPEKLVYKVLDKLTAKHGETDGHTPFTLNMRKVKLPNYKKRAVETIVNKSLTWVGLAA